MRNYISKAFVCAGIMASAIALNSIAVFAGTINYSDQTYTNGDGTTKSGPTIDGTKTTTVYNFEANTNTSDDVKVDVANTVLSNGVVTVGTNVKLLKKSGGIQVNGSSNGLLFPINDNTKKVTLEVTTTGASPTRTLTVGKNYTVETGTSGESITIPSLTADDYTTIGTQRYLKATGSGDCKVKVYTIIEDSSAATFYTAGGDVINNDNYSGTLTIGNDTVDYSNGTYSIDLTNGTYDVTLDSSLYTVSPTSITVNGSDVDQDITITAVDTVTVSGEIDEDLGLTDTNSVKLINASGEEFVATSDGSVYSVSVPQNATYTVSVLGDAGYLGSNFMVSETSVPVATTNVKFDLTATAINNVWDFATYTGTSLPNNKDGYSAGTNYKGITVTAKGKFAPQSPAESGKTYGRTQVNKGTTLTLPEFDTASNEVVVYTTTGSSAYDKNTRNDTISDLTITDNVITYSGSSSIYITKIAIVASAPSLTLSASDPTDNTSRLSATINNVNANNTIKKITVNLGTDSAAITKLKKETNGYSFYIDVKNSSSEAKAGSVVLKYLTDKSTSTTATTEKTYAFTSAAGGAITFN